MSPKIQKLIREHSEAEQWHYVNTKENSADYVSKEIVLSVLGNHALTWSKMVRIFALMMLFLKNLKTKIKQRKMITSDEVSATLITTTMIQESRMSLVKLVQQQHFKEEYKWLKLMVGKDSDSKRLNKNCRISQLDPFIDESDVIRVGGNFQKFSYSDDCKHPILLPRKGKASDLIIKH